MQVPVLVNAGKRPAIPPRGELPGPDTASWQGLAAYCRLMRWEGWWFSKLRAPWMPSAMAFQAQMGPAALHGGEPFQMTATHGARLASWQSACFFNLSAALWHARSPDYPPQMLCVACSDCWSQDPAARPSFDDILPRLAELAEQEG